MADEKKRGLKARSIQTVDYKLRYLLPMDEKLGTYTSAQAQALYEAEMERISRYGRAMRVQTHHSVLKITKRFFLWAVERKYIRFSPFEKIKPIGKPSAGKEQLRMGSRVSRRSA